MLLYKVASFVVIDFENGVDYISFSVFDFSALKNGTEYSFVNDQFQVNDYTDVTFIFDKNGNPYTEATLDYFIETIKVIADPNIGNLPAGGTASQILSKIDSTDYNAQWIDNLLRELKDVNIVSAVNKNTIFYNSSNSLWENRLIEISDVTNLQSNLNAKEPTINAGTTSQYWRGDKTWQTLNKSAVGLGNVDNTSDLNKPISTATQTALNAKQNNITLTTVGDSGPATLIGSVLNIPEYAQDLSGYVPYVGAVSDLNLGVHRILAQRGYFENNGSNDTLNVIHSSGSGYGINVSKGGSGEALRVNKTSGSGNAASILGGVTLIDELHLNTDLSDSYIASASNWNSAFNDKINSASVTGTTTKTLTLNQQDGGTITASWTDINTDAVSSVFGRVGAVVAVNGDYNTSQVTESSNLYYTEARVNANANVAANTLARHDAVTIGTANGLSLSGQQLSLGLASASSNGALSASDWSTFNNKQNALTNPITGTGTLNYIPKFTGSGTIGNSLIFDNGTNVGIGTTNPQAALSFANVVGNKIDFYHSGNDRYGIQVQDSELRIHSGAVGDLNGGITFGKSTTTTFSEAMRITNAGKVGIGVTNPGNRLVLANSYYLAWQSSVGIESIGIAALSDNSLSFFNQSERMRITEGGSTLFNTTTDPTTGGFTNTTVLIKQRADGLFGGGLHIEENGTTAVAYFGFSGSVFNIGTSYRSTGDYRPITFSTFGSERLRIANNGNIGINTTNPTEKLQVIGNGRFGFTSGNNWGIDIDHGIGASDYGRVRFYQNGSNYSTIHSFSSNWQSGTIFSASSGALNLDAVNGTTIGLWYDPDVVFVKGGTSYLKNNVGIGTTSPDDKLDVEGYIRMSGTSSASAILGGIAASWGGSAQYPTLYSTDVTRWIMLINPHISYTQNGINGYSGAMNGSSIRFASDTSATTYWDLGVGVNSVGTDKYSIGRSGNSFLAVDNSGNVGIGTSNPNDKFHVVGGIYSTSIGNPINGSIGAIQIGYDGTNGRVRTWNSSPLIYSAYNYQSWETTGSERMRITDSGYVGIGQSNPQSLLHLKQSSSNFFRMSRGSASNYGFELGVSNDFYIYDYNNSRSALTILNSGSVGVGTDTPDPSAILDLTSTTQGFLPPRMDNSEINAISNPAEGLIVYSTQSKCLFLFDGANWQKIAYA
jgi:hypothetical protein